MSSEGTGPENQGRRSTCRACGGRTDLVERRAPCPCDAPWCTVRETVNVCPACSAAAAEALRPEGRSGYKAEPR
jgi:hypothetical protein